MSTAERRSVEREIETDENLTEAEREEVVKRQRPTAITVFATIRRGGDEELLRSMQSLWWSGIAAGIGLPTSILAEAVIHRAVGVGPGAIALESFGYSLGFVLVILARQQLFTENTLSVVLPVLVEPTLAALGRSARLWGIVLAANLVGTFVTSFLVLKLGMSSPENIAAMIEVSRHVTDAVGWDALVRGIPAGFYIAAMVWMLPSSKGFEIAVITVFAWLIAAGGFVHVIVGSAEVFMLVIHGELGLAAGLWSILLPALVAELVGGTGLFARLAYGQIKADIE